MARLLGISAFAGFVVLLIGWPLNNFIARRAIRIQKGVSAARDKRMGVLNELIGAVKFIKFFAWEERWIQRVLGARETELQWFIKGASQDSRHLLGDLREATFSTHQLGFVLTDLDASSHPYFCDGFFRVHYAR